MFEAPEDYMTDETRKTLIQSLRRCATLEITAAKLYTECAQALLAAPGGACAADASSALLLGLQGQDSVGRSRWCSQAADSMEGGTVEPAASLPGVGDLS
jgi:hypothetical protein